MKSSKQEQFLQLGGPSCQAATGLFSAQNKSAGARGGEEGEIYPSTSLTLIGHKLLRRASGFVHGKYAKSFRQKGRKAQADKMPENRPKSPFL